MPSRPDIRDLASNVRDAFAEMDRDALLDILTFVVKEYVVEGPPPTLIHQAETLADLKPANFSQLITALQTRFDFPELATLVVDGNSVGVRIGGVVQPILAQRTPPIGAAMPAATQVTASPGSGELIDTRPEAAGSPGVRIVEMPLQQRPQPPASAPPPSRGLSVRGRANEPSVQPPARADAPASPPAAAPAPTAPPTSPATASVPEKPDKPEGSGDDASARFSLLELD